MRYLLLLSTCALIVASEPLAFEVASIHPNHSGSGSSTLNLNHGRLSAVNISTAMLMQNAFGIRDYQVEGSPGWFSSEMFDIAAKTDPSIDRDEEFQPYIQTLLADRFHLKYHRETRQVAALSLVVAKAGSKLIPSAGEGGSSTRISGNNGRISLTTHKTSMSRFADILSRQLRRPVVDNTGIAGEFDIQLDWVSDQSTAMDGASIFTALQERAGLHLESTKAPLAVFVIDSIERPTEN